MRKTKPQTRVTLDPRLAGRILAKLDPASAAIFADVLRLAYNNAERRDVDGEWTDGEADETPCAAPAEPAPKTKKDYQDEADKIVGYTPLKVQPSSTMNRRITAAYAHMYISNPAFQWAGLAAYASGEVGRGMQEAQKNVARRIFGGNDIHEMLTTGNRAVYNDIYWQFLAYKNGGMAQMGRLLQSGELPQELYVAWQLIDLGTRNNDPGALSQGNAKIAKYERDVTLHNAIYRNPNYADAAKIAGSMGNITSPVPGDPNGFQKVVPNGNLANRDDRWKWIEKSVWPAWQKYLKTHQDEIRRSMQGYDKNYYPANPK